MKPLLLIALACCMMVSSCRMNKLGGEGAVFNRNATASISRVKLFTDPNTTVTKIGDSTTTVTNNEISPTLYWAQFDATKRSSLVAAIPDPNNKAVSIKVLAENTPDAAIESISKITAQMKNKDFTAEVAGEVARSIAQIKRSSAVENFRTISYRLAELVNNKGDVDPGVEKLFESLISSSVKTAEWDSNVSLKEAELGIKEAELGIKKVDEAIANRDLKEEALKTLQDELKNATDADTKDQIREQIVRLVSGGR